jgi:hypothetical protein
MEGLYPLRGKGASAGFGTFMLLADFTNSWPASLEPNQVICGRRQRMYCAPSQVAARPALVGDLEWSPRSGAKSCPFPKAAPLRLPLPEGAQRDGFQ